MRRDPRAPARPRPPAAGRDPGNFVRDDPASAARAGRIIADGLARSGEAVTLAPHMIGGWS